MKLRLRHIIWALCFLVLFYGLGKAQLFEPDEGRNAEIAREILVTGDWVTPHDDFLPALDKPIAFFWLVASAYHLFGISEGPARLPSALAALGCLVLVYRFCRNSFGVYQALWTLVILTTSVEFFLLSRIVIFDMTLTLCISLALFSFYAATQAEDERSRKHFCFVMYAAMGAGSLIKGPIGVVVPVMVIGVYLLLRKKLTFISQMNLLTGSLIFFAILVPWYSWVESRNPGYLKYFLWEEHFLRFLTPHFGRTEPWYYFFPVLAAGFSPWTIMLPVVVNDLRKERFDDKILFLILWAVLPFAFFSLSSTKLPHYILPIFPPLAILTGCSLELHFRTPNSKGQWILAVIWLVEFLSLFYFALGTIWPELLPEGVRPVMLEVRSILWLFVCGALAALAMTMWIGRRGDQNYLEGSVLRFFFITMMLVPLVMVHITAGVSRFRSAKDLAENARRFVTPADQLVLYDTYLGGLLFYLKVTEPIWLVWSGTKSNIMGSWYVAEMQPPPAKEKVLFTFKEFEQAWRGSDQRLLVYVKDSNFSRFKTQSVVTPKELSKTANFILATNR
jgi:4-amino-4-deoxy-L-arabinose transferase-like glycosyltransferase